MGIGEFFGGIGKWFRGAGEWVNQKVFQPIKRWGQGVATGLGIINKPTEIDPTDTAFKAGYGSGSMTRNIGYPIVKGVGTALGFGKAFDGLETVGHTLANDAQTAIQAQW
jgi:hypothetical protein